MTANALLNALDASMWGFAGAPVTNWLNYYHRHRARRPSHIQPGSLSRYRLTLKAGKPKETAAG